MSKHFFMIDHYAESLFIWVLLLLVAPAADSAVTISRLIRHAR
ncbi:hypothetical protein [Leptolyngbya sp. BC1307]|nr:hypothetical protein [Leptolyngbya sp. BC1307]